jgi:hypothetical protein
MVPVIHGAIAMACGIAGLFFLRYWRSTHDSLFAYFAAAFWVLAVHWTVLGLTNTDAEHRHFLYLPRLLAFVLIVIGAAVRNRRRR